MHIIVVVVLQEMESTRTYWRVEKIYSGAEVPLYFDEKEPVLAVAMRPALTLLDTAELRTWLTSVILAVAPNWRMSLNWEESYLASLLSSLEGGDH